MAGRQLHRLNALRISKGIAPGYYADGGGLYLQISTSGSRSWIFRFTIAGRTREMGLGPLSMVSLAAARKQAAECRQLVKQRIDPIGARNKHERERLLQAAAPEGVTFREAAEAYIRDRESTWKNPKHAQQWRNTIATYAYPVIGRVDVRDIDTEMIVRVLQPIWSKKAETARRVRGRIKAILDAEAVLGHRSGDNPTRYVDHLDGCCPVRRGASRSSIIPRCRGKKCPSSSASLRCIRAVPRVHCIC
jgi:hypothetical protein